MNRDRIQTSLQAIFQDDARWPHKGRRIVFWYDPDGQFRPDFEALDLPGITPFTLGDTPFTTKHQLLIEAPEQSFLLYAPFAEPSPADNWLLDIQKSSQLFSADRAALIFADLKLNERSLEGVIRQHLKFFNSGKPFRTCPYHLVATSRIFCWRCFVYSQTLKSPMPQPLFAKYSWPDC
jgi:hypothetical protein